MTSPNLVFNPTTGEFDAVPCKFNWLDFNKNPSLPAGEYESRLSWNPTDKTFDVCTGLGPNLQMGFEDWFWVYNDTDDEIENGKVVHPIGGATSGRPHIEKAIANDFTGLTRAIWVTTMAIPSKTAGIVTFRGNVRGIDTSMFFVGDNLWVSPDVAGEFVSTIPEFPDYPIQIGGVAVSDDEDGEIVISVKGEIEDTVVNFWNGVIRESFDFLITSDGSTITGSLSPTNGHPDLTMMFSDGFTMLDTTPPATIELTPAGDDAIPVTNYIYIPKSTKVLTVSTSAWPTTIEHIRIAQVFLQTAATTETEGALRNQNWNDHIEDTTTFQGHLSHIGAKLRQFEAQWDSGAEGSISIDAGAVYVKTTSGSIFQMHPQSYPAQDMTQYTIDAVNQGNKTFTITGDGDLSSTFTDGKTISVHGVNGNEGRYTIVSSVWSDPDFIITVEETIPSATPGDTMGDDIHIVNSDNGAYTETTDLTSETNDASGDPLNNTSFSIVVWGVANKGGEPPHLMANMPISTYNKNFPEQAVVDAAAASVYTIPKAFQGVGFLIMRNTYVNSGGTWTLHETQDLRGFLPNTTAGAGAGASGITTFAGLTDTPSSYIGQAGKVPVVNSGETALEFQNQSERAVQIIATSQSEGNLNLSDITNWNVDTSNISTIGTVSSSTDYLIEVYPDDTFTTPDFSFNHLSGTELLRINFNYEDLDVTKEVHIKYTDNEGTDTVDLDIRGTELR